MSQQGKEYTKEQRDAIVESLKPFLQMGDTVRQACISAEFDYTTFWRWLEKDEALSIKVKSWQAMVNSMAKQVIIKKIRGEKNEQGVWVSEPDVETAQWWLEKKDRKEFGKNLDVTTDGESINAPTVVKWVVQTDVVTPKDEEVKTD